MKTLMLFLFLGTIAFSQSSNVRKLSKPLQYSDEKQIDKLVQTIIQLYGPSFKYYNELCSKNYVVSTHDNGYILNIIESNNNESKTSSGIVEKIKINRIKEENGNYSLMYDKIQMDKLIDRKKFYSMNMKLSTDNVDTIININSFLKDMCIMTDPSTNDCYHKVFNRSQALAHIVDTNSNPSPLFSYIADGLILPYEGGEKLVELDELWCSLIHFDINLASNIWHYGEYGSSDHQFYLPTAMTYGRETVSGSTTTYPIYIADQGNSRIVFVNYIARDPSLGSGFDPSSWEVLNNSVVYPYDIGIFKAESSEDDKIWVSEAPQVNPSLACLDMDGSLVQRVIGYKDTNTSTIYPFEAGSQIRLSVYHNYFSSISFIDNMRNILVCCQLNEDGTARLESYGDGYLIRAHGVESFPSGVKINSVSFQKTSINTIEWPYLWVTSGYTPPYYDSSQNLIHCFKINAYSHVQYIGSTSKPDNTDWDFVGLDNSIMNHGYYDIFTIERWSDGYGLRQFRPSVGIRDVTLHNYCTDSIDYMKWESVLTNDCDIDLTAFRKNSTAWDSVKIKKINNWTYNSNLVSIYRLAGNTESDSGRFINICLDLPLKDYIFGNSIKLHSKLYPEWTSSYYIERDDSTIVQKTCLPKSGGCPFLYVKDTNSNYNADNNVLHRSEFSPSGTDILDNYKLRITPQIVSGKIEINLVENENDSSYINQVRLFAIDYPKTKKMGITEGNLIVLYDSSTVKAADTVKRNSTIITSDVNFNSPGTPVNGSKTDSLYAHFHYSDGSFSKKIKQNNSKKAIDNDKGKSVNSDQKAKSILGVKNGPGGSPPTFAFISDLRNLVNPSVSVKDTGGVLTATSIYSNTVTGIFARRELNSVVILPLFGDSNKVDHFKIKWQSDYQMKYLGIATLEYTGYTSTELSLWKAAQITRSSSSTITSNLTDVDSTYGLVTDSGLVQIQFDASGLPSLRSDARREFVIEVTGHYFAGTGSMNPNVHKPQVQLPLTYKLSQNYPNPFNPTTKINYEIPNDSKVKLIVYDILGREVIKLVNNEFKKAGNFVVNFDGTNLASGVYFYRIEAGTFTESKKMVLIK